MKLRGLVFRMTAFGTLLILALTGAACGGGGGSASGGNGGPGPMGRVVAFAPMTTSPGNNTVSFGAGTVNGDMVTIPVMVTGTNDFFGAQFTMQVDRRVAFLSADTSGTFVTSGGSTMAPEISAVEGNSTAAFTEVIVTVTRFQSPGNPPQYIGGVDVTTSSELISLTFQATADFTGGQITFVSSSATTCNDAAQTCTPNGAVTFMGGTFSASS